MQIRAGSLLIAHPVYAHREQRKHVVYVTESTQVSTMGLVLNNVSNYDLKEVFHSKGIEWYGPREVYHGGEYNNSALVMLHSDEWYSSNTTQVNNQLGMSSDSLMIEKMEMGDTPDWYRLFVGCKGWEHDDLGYELKSKKPKWLLLSNPSIDLLDTAPDLLWNAAIHQSSQELFNNYF